MSKLISPLLLSLLATMFSQVWMMEQTSPERWSQASMKESNNESLGPMKIMLPMWAVWSNPSWVWKLWVNFFSSGIFSSFFTAHWAFCTYLYSFLLFCVLFCCSLSSDSLSSLFCLFDVALTDTCRAAQTAGVLLSSLWGAWCQQASQTETVPAAERGLPLQWPAACKTSAQWYAAILLIYS